MLSKIKLRLLTAAVIAIIFTLITQGTLAFYSTVGKATNVVTSGNIKFIIHETTDTGDEFPAEGVYIVPGDIVSKRVSIENDCAHPFYLRVKPVYAVDNAELSAEDCFKLDIDESNWQYYEGWYYYKGILNPGETTPNFFSKVEIVGNKMDNSYLGSTLTITVTAHAVQSENNPVNGTDTYTASGWPQE